VSIQTNIHTMGKLLSSLRVRRHLEFGHLAKTIWTLFISEQFRSESSLNRSNTQHFAELYSFLCTVGYSTRFVGRFIFDLKTFTVLGITLEGFPQ